MGGSTAKEYLDAALVFARCESASVWTTNGTWILLWTTDAATGFQSYGPLFGTLQILFRMVDADGTFIDGFGTIQASPGGTDKLVLRLT